LFTIEGEHITNIIHIPSDTKILIASANGLFQNIDINGLNATNVESKKVSIGEVCGQLIFGKDHRISRNRRDGT
jgi:hypothetical protein